MSYKVKPMNLGKVLQQIRRSRKLTQAKVSELVGLTRSSISLIEGTERTPSPENVKSFADLYEVPVEAIYLLASEPSADEEYNKKRLRFMEFTLSKFNI